MHLSPTVYLPPAALAYLAALAALMLLVSAASRRWRPHPVAVWTVAIHALVMAVIGEVWLPERILGGLPPVAAMSYTVLACSAAVVALALPATAAGGALPGLSRLAARLVMTYGVLAAVAGPLWLHLGPRVDERLEAGGGPAYTCEAPRDPGAYVCT